MGLTTSGRHNSEAATWVLKKDGRVDKVDVTTEFIRDRVTGSTDGLLSGGRMRVDSKVSIEELIRFSDRNGETERVPGRRNTGDMYVVII